MKGISQKSIASALGVSQAIVSLVLNGNKKRVSEETYNEIWNYALENGYTPKGINLDSSNILATSSLTIGYILRAPLKLATTSNFFSHVLQGLDDCLRPKGIYTTFYGSEDDIDPIQLHKSISKNKALIGIVVMGETDEAFLQRVSTWKKPTVYVNARFPGLCHSINANEYQAAHKLLEHFSKLGHKKIAYIGSITPVSINSERFRAFQKAIKLFDFEFNPKHHYIEPQATRNDGHNAANKLINIPAKERPTAWICAGGLLARGAVDTIIRHGLTPGKEISVSAFDMTRVCYEEFPTITGAATKPEDLGKKAGNILLDSKNKDESVFQDLILPATLQEGESTGVKK